MKSAEYPVVLLSILLYSKDKKFTGAYLAFKNFVFKIKIGPPDLF